MEKMWPFPGQGEASKAWSATVPVRCGDKEGLQGSVGGQEGSPGLRMEGPPPRNNYG